MRPNFFQHIHPPSIPEEQARWRYTLGAGGIAIFLGLILGVTGALEMFYYIPSTVKPPYQFKDSVFWFHLVDWFETSITGLLNYSWLSASSIY